MASADHLFTDPRIRAEYVEYPSPRGSGRMRGYFVMPTAETRMSDLLRQNLKA